MLNKTNLLILATATILVTNPANAVKSKIKHSGEGRSIGSFLSQMSNQGYQASNGGNQGSYSATGGLQSRESLQSSGGLGNFQWSDNQLQSVLGGLQDQSSCSCPTEAPATTTPVPTSSATCSCQVSTTTPAPTTQAATTAAPTTTQAATTQAATTTPAPTPSIPGGSSSVPTTTPAASTCSCEQQCTAENTANDQYNQEYNCNWVYNTDYQAWMCIQQDCTWQFFSSNCSWECIPNASNNTVPPSSNSTPPANNNTVCNYTCDDIANLISSNQFLSSFVEQLNQTVSAQSDQISLLASALVDAAAAIGNITEQQVTMGQSIDALSARVQVLESTDYVSEVKNDLQANGLYLGNRWWIGEQYDQLFAIDILSPSYYRFRSGYNATL